MSVDYHFVVVTEINIIQKSSKFAHHRNIRVRYN